MSSEMTEHDHCRYCGDCVPSEQAYCSVECYYKDQERTKKEKQREIFWGAVAIIGCVAILGASLLF